MSKRKLDKNDDYYLTDDSRIELDVDKFAQSATMRAAIEKLKRQKPAIERLRLQKHYWARATKKYKLFSNKY